MPHIHIKNNFVEYDFSIDSKYLFISGMSGAGKTTLINLVDSLSAPDSGIVNTSDINLIRYQRESDFMDSGSVILFDEGDPILRHPKISRILKKTGNYIIIMSRDMHFYKYVKAGLDSYVFMHFDRSTNRNTLKRRFVIDKELRSISHNIACEDAKSGADFIEQVLGLPVYRAGSNTKLWSISKKHSDCIFVLDRAGLSYQLFDQIEFLKIHNCELVGIIDWDSFESYILESEHYNVRVPSFPDKEANAFKLFKETIDSNYDKSSLPNNLYYPIYGKVANAIQLLNDYNPEQLEWSISNAPIALRRESLPTLLEQMESSWLKHCKGEL